MKKTDLFDAVKSNVSAHKTPIIILVSLIIGVSAGLVTAGSSHEVKGSSGTVKGASTVKFVTGEKSDNPTTGSTANNSQQSTPSTKPSASPSGGNTVKSSTSTTGATSTGTVKTQAPKADYNLNENWYITEDNGMGLYNTCWPTAFTELNEAECGDSDNAYSQTWFTGLGISKNPSASASLASAQLNAKAAAQHVEIKKGVEGDTLLLTSALCTQYSLSCDRW